MGLAAIAVERGIMSTFIFGVITGFDHKPTRAQARAIAKIAKSEEAEFVECNVRRGDEPGINGGVYQAWFTAPSPSWFAARNWGEPFYGDHARCVHAALIAAGLGRFTSNHGA